MNAKYKRRNYFIDKEFQGKYIFNAFLLVTLGSILFALIFSFFSSNTLSIVYDNYHLKLGTTPGILLNKILSSQWLFIVLGGFAIALLTLFFTHRIAGPFFRFEKTLDAMMAKDVSIRIFLRPKDQGKELAKKINQFNEMMSSNLTLMRQNATQIALCCHHIDAAEADEEKMALLKSELIKIKQYSQSSISILNEFKIIKE